MGKASKWMINFLLLGKKKEILSYQEKPAPPPLKKRWSFGKIKRSNDSNDISSFSTSFSVDYSITSTGGTTAKFPVGPGRRRAARDAAATRIQAAFRSYLARKALHALRALVKLQALVRGHQVRKRMESTLRSMHALMSIQVRARIQRIQMVEETQSQIGLKSQSSRYSGSSIEQETRKITPGEANEVNSNEKSATFRNKNRENERTGPILKTYQSGDLSFLRREHQLEECLATARSSPLYSLVGTQAASGRASLFNNQRQEYPNYMVNTESSKAKVRSQSVPKQRPLKAKIPGLSSCIDRSGRRRMIPQY